MERSREIKIQELSRPWRVFIYSVIGGVLWIAGVALLAFLGVPALEGIDKDKYGSVPIPGQRTLTLPERQVTIHYDELRPSDVGVGIEGLGERTIPRDFTVRITPTPQTGGERILVPPDDTRATLNDDGEAEYARFDVPAAGDYVVAVTAGRVALAEAKLGENYGDVSKRLYEDPGEFFSTALGILATIAALLGLVAIGFAVRWLSKIGPSSGGGGSREPGAGEGAGPDG